MQLENSVIAGIMIPDALTPGQYYDGMRADDSSARPIKRLMLAVLEDAMRCYQTCANSRSRAQRRLFVEAEGWLMDRRGDGPFAFDTVCEALGINASCLREGLRKWRLQQLDGLNPRRLARRSPVTRVGRISAPLKRRRRKISAVAAIGIERANAINGNGHSNGNSQSSGNGVASHRDGHAHEELHYDVRHEVEGVNGNHRHTDPRFSTRIEVQEAAL
jgi:hypothetical protein